MSREHLNQSNGGDSSFCDHDAWKRMLRQEAEARGLNPLDPEVLDDLDRELSGEEDEVEPLVVGFVAAMLSSGACNDE